MNQWHVRVDNKGNIDQADIQRQLQQKADQKVSQFKFGCIFSIVFAVLVVGILGAVGIYVWYAYKHGGGSSVATGAGTVGKWDGTSTFTCSGNDKVTLTGINATLKSGDAIDASGNCQLTITGANITAPTVISATGNAVVTLTGGNITGSTAAIAADGNAHVVIVGANVKGKVTKSGLAKVDGVGVNQ